MPDDGPIESERGARLPRELVLASAGTGKTFLLSSTIVALLNAGASPGEVFASSFTRKAAGEILERVLLRLARAQLEGEALAELSVHASLEGAPPLDLDRVGILLGRVVAELDRVNVSTLDSFFHKVARVFTFELGLAPSWTVADSVQEERLVLAAVDTLLKEADEGELVELLRMYRSGEVGRSVHGELMNIVSHLQRIYRDLDPLAEEPWGFSSPANGETPAAQIDALADRIAAEPVPKTKQGAPRKNWANALRGHTEALRDRSWEDLLGTGIFLKLLEGADTYDRVVIPDAIRAHFEQAREMARAALGAQLAGRAKALGRLAHDYERAFAHAQREQGVFRFEDVPHLLIKAGLINTDDTRPADELFYRLDGRIRHLLLDEFQDTSLIQWRALAPLADEILQSTAGDRAALLVADPKQSIYAWRGGEPRLIDFVAARSRLPRRTLDESYRSAAPVLDFVNRVFEDLSAASGLKPEEKEVAENWLEGFRPHRAARTELPGYVRIVEVPGEDHRREVRDGILERAVVEVEELTREAPAASVGVLCRTRKTVARLIHLLRRAGIEVSDEGGSPVTDAWPTHLLSAALRLADHPGDRLAAYLVAKSPLGPELGLSGGDPDASADAVSYRVRRDLLVRGYGPVLDDWARILQPLASGREQARLAQLVELGFRQDSRAFDLRPSRFVRLAEATSVEAPGGARVRVMTVHGAKGLEFDAVVLPELERPFRRGGRDHGPLPARDHPAGPVTRVHPYLNRSLQPLFPEIEAADQERRAARFRDELGGLYVSLTRPRFALHLLIEQGREGTATPARLLREALGLDPGESERGAAGVVWEGGDRNWATHVSGIAERDVPAGSSRPAVDGPGSLQVKMADGPRSRGLVHVSPSELEGGGARSLPELLRRRDRAALGSGTLVHLWLAEIRWLEDGVPEDEELIALARARARGVDDPHGLLEQFHEWIEAPAIRRILSRNAYPEGTAVDRELPFLAREGGRIVQGVADRVIRIPEGEDARLVVVDWKTDRVGPDTELTQRVSFYRPQVEAYIRSMARSEGMPEGRVSGALAFLRAGEVREIAGD